MEGRSVILTFGLLSPDKGIEHVIDALPTILERFPETVYVVLGATHPHVRERQGEMYRLMLENRAKALGVDSHTIFHNRFVSPAELSEFLAASDIYVTPYLKPEQITSGTLAYAIGSGKAAGHVSPSFRCRVDAVLLQDPLDRVAPQLVPSTVAAIVLLGYQLPIPAQDRLGRGDRRHRCQPLPPQLPANHEGPLDITTIWPDPVSAQDEVQVQRRRPLCLRDPERSHALVLGRKQQRHAQRGRRLANRADAGQGVAGGSRRPCSAPSQLGEALRQLFLQAVGDAAELGRSHLIAGNDDVAPQGRVRGFAGKNVRHAAVGLNRVRYTARYG